jgi:hypothetical protein
MPRGDTPQPDGRAGANEPDAADGEAARQRDILAQFQDAIAGMRTREIQIGLRELLARSGPPPRTPGPPPRPPVPPPRTPGPPGPPATGANPETGHPRAAVSSGKGPFSSAMTGAVTGRHDDDGGPGDAPAPGMGPGIGTVPAPVARLICAVRTPTARRQIQRLVTDAELDQVVQLDAPAATRMVRPYSWLLDRTGTGGIRLTDAGHLPPAEVSAAVGELGLSTGGPGRRESQVEPVRRLRESAQATGLLHKQRGQLLLTACGAGLRSDPAALWWHLAERMPLRTAGPEGVQPGLIMLVCVAAGATVTLNATIAGMLTAIGWMNTDGGPLTGGQAAQAADSTRAVLGRLGALPGGPGAGGLGAGGLGAGGPGPGGPGAGGPGPGGLGAGGPGPGGSPWPTPEGVAFARAALRTWPPAS